MRRCHEWFKLGMILVGIPLLILGGILVLMPFVMPTKTVAEQAIGSLRQVTTLHFPAGSSRTRDGLYAYESPDGPHCLIAKYEMSIALSCDWGQAK